MDEPEIHLVLDAIVVVPDIAGWLRDRLPQPPAGHKVEATPTWVCEVASPSTARIDREMKMPLYAHHGVELAWLVDPDGRRLETFVLTDGEWARSGVFRDGGLVSAAPFEAVTVRLVDLWGRALA